MPAWLLILSATLGLAVVFALVFLVARRIDNYGIVDIAWSYAFAASSNSKPSPRNLKYSACLYATGQETLDQAEEAMLALYAERAQLADGQHILELGCGWGSLCLYNARHFPHAQITAVSNSRTQKDHIDTEARKHGLSNLRVITSDINAFDITPAQIGSCRSRCLSTSRTTNSSSGTSPAG